MPGGDTFAHPVLTLGNRFADNEDLLLSTYLHEQMHWYLWHLGTPDRDMVAPFYDELVRRYPDAPIELPDGARNYDATYSHLVVNWLEIAATSEFIGRERAFAVARATRSYRWIYRTVVRDWDLLGELYERHDIVPIRTAEALQAGERQGREHGPQRRPAKKSRSSARGARLLDPAVDLGRVVAGRLAEDARPVLDATALGVGRAEVEPPDARERDGRRAHRAGLQRDVEVGVRQPLRSERGAGRADRQHLGVRGRIVQLARAVAGARQHAAVGATTTAPTGTSPRAPAASASARAASIWLCGWRGVI